ncbi:hypothetical protein ES703_09771 [subsurface metagenome]
MKKIIGLGIAVAVVIALVTTGTFALFSDTETSSPNTFTAGIIDLEIDCDGDTVFTPTDDPPEIFNYLPASDIKPGDDGEVTLSLHLKTGSNDADLWMQVQNLNNYGGVLSEPEEEEENGTPDDDIASEILVKLWIDDGDNIWEDGEVVLYDDTLSGLTAKLTVQLDAVASTTYYVGWSWELPSAVGNEHQGDYCTFDIVFGADQVTP